MNYKNIFSDKRRTLVIKITQGEIYVYAPARLDNEKGRKIIAGFVADKAAWIEKKTREYRLNAALYPGLLELEIFYWHGSAIKYVLSEERKRIGFDGKFLTVPKSLVDNQQELQTQLKKIFKRQAQRELSLRLNYLSGLCGLHYEQFGLTDAAGKWGLCTSAKKIMLNWRLAVIDESLADYVMLHELCHLKEMNHSRDFWNLLSEFLPDWKSRRAQLKHYDFLMRFLR